MTRDERNQLVEKNMPLVYHIINTRYPQLTHDDDLIQTAMLALIRAVDTWDSSRSKLQSWIWKVVVWSIRRELKRRVVGYDEQPLSLDMEYGFEDDGTTLGDMIPGEVGVEVAQSTVYGDLLDDKEKIILEWVARGGKPSDLTERLGMSRQAINGYYRRALYKIKKHMWEE